MTGYVGNIEKETLSNDFFRRVIFTGRHSQLVLMSLNPKEEIGIEVHQSVDQFFRVEAGEAKAILNGEKHTVGDGDAILVPSGTNHNIVNTSAVNKLKLYTIYSPANHKDGTIRRTKAEADADKADHV